MVARAAVAGGGDVAEYVVSGVLQRADMDLASPLSKYLGSLFM